MINYDLLRREDDEYCYYSFVNILKSPCLTCVNKNKDKDLCLPGCDLPKTYDKKQSHPCIQWRGPGPKEKKDQHVKNNAIDVYAEKRGIRAEILLRQMREKDMTHAEIATEIGTSKPTVTRYLNKLGM